MQQSERVYALEQLLLGELLQLGSCIYKGIDKIVNMYFIMRIILVNNTCHKYISRQ